MRDGPPPVRLDDVRKAYGRHRILGEISLRVAGGEAVAVVGRNGAGKSTLLDIAAGGRSPDGGSVRIAGHDPFGPGSAAWRWLGYVPEDPHLYAELTLDEHVEFVAAMRGIDEIPRTARVARMAEGFGLEGARRRPVRELSRGMARKTALLLALLHAPRAVVMDEPFSGLDPDSTAALRRELGERLADGAGVLVASHRLDLLAALCHRGVALTGGGEWRPLEGEVWEAWRADPHLPEARDGGTSGGERG